MLKLNDNKTEIMAIGEPRRNLMELQLLTVGNEEVDVTKCVRPLDVDFDSDLTLKHVRNVAKKCFYTLKNMFKIRRCINKTADKQWFIQWLHLNLIIAMQFPMVCQSQSINQSIKPLFMCQI